MRPQLARLGKQTLIYGVGGVLLPLVGLLTLPVFARVFQTDEYGVIDLVTVAMAVAALLVDAGLASALQRSYFDYPEGAEARRTVVFTAVVTSLGLSLVFAALIIVFRETLADWLFGDAGYGDALAIAALNLPVATAAALARQIMRLRFQPWRFLISSTLGALVGAGAAVTAVVYFDLGVKGVFAGILVGNLVALAYGGTVALPHVGRQFSRRELRVMLAYGLPLIPTALAMWALQFLDRVMLAKLGALSDVGQYAVANRVTMVLILAVAAFGMAYSPFMLSMFSEDPEGEKRFRGRVLTYVGTGLAVAAVLVSLVAQEVTEVLAPRFDEAYRAVWLLAIAIVAYGMSTVAMSGISLTRKTGFFAIYAGVAAVVNIGLNLVLIPVWGMEGAAAATAVAYVLLTGLYYRRSQLLYPTPYEPAKLARLAVLTLAFLPLGLITMDPPLVALVVKLGIALSFVALLRIARVITAEDVATLRAALRRDSPTPLPQA